MVYAIFKFIVAVHIAAAAVAISLVFWMFVIGIIRAVIPL